MSTLEDILSENEIVDLVKRIVAFNNCWHTIRDDIKRESNHVSDDQEAMLELLGNSIKNLRDIKSRLQIQLLRRGGGLATLEYDPKIQSEACYSVRLARMIAKRKDACHIPVRIAKRLLYPEELEILCTIPEPIQETLTLEESHESQ